MALSRADKNKLLEKMRNNKSKKDGFRDPTEWRPKFKKNEDQTFRIYVLMPLLEGDKCLGGKDNEVIECKKDWDLYYYQRGNHFVNKKSYECPRVRDGSDCPMCSVGFDLMREVDDKDARKAIAKEWLSQENHIVNIYFPDHKDNPQDLRGEVRWWRLPLGIWKQCEEAFDRKDAGDDEDDPQPFGMFFDPEGSFPIKISLQEKAGYNNYDGSKMLGVAYPLSKDSDEIDKILEKRIDIQTKFPDPSKEDLQKLCDKKLSESGAGGSSDSGFDDDQEDEVKEEKETKKSEDKEESKSKSEDKEESKSDAEDKEESKSEDKEESKSDEDEDGGELDDEMKKLLAELE